uniref:Uncharacterized protein n=1 Tax=viral metagenome TaxID=1070528 RepID=A0A6M3ISF6_9ZZZZ
MRVGGMSECCGSGPSNACTGMQLVEIINKRIILLRKVHKCVLSFMEILKRISRAEDIALVAKYLSVPAFHQKTNESMAADPKLLEKFAGDIQGRIAALIVLRDVIPTECDVDPDYLAELSQAVMHAAESATNGVGWWGTD